MFPENKGGIVRILFVFCLLAALVIPGCSSKVPLDVADAVALNAVGGGVVIDHFGYYPGTLGLQSSGVQVLICKQKRNSPLQLVTVVCTDPDEVRVREIKEYTWDRVDGWQPRCFPSNFPLRVPQ